MGRRTCLKGIGGLAAAAGGVGTLTGRASAATTRHGIEFDRVLDAVDDLGCDPNGNEPVQNKIKNANLDGSLLYFPDGEYLITERLVIVYKNTVGMVGEGNARFVVPENYNDEAVLIDRGKYVLFENMDLDLRANGATPGFKFGAHNKAEIHTVELIGQGIHPNSDPRGEGYGNPSVATALHLVARQSTANVTVENFVARNQGLMGAYNHGNGRLGVWVGRTNKGTVTMRNCHISGFPNNGLYTSRTPGVVQVEGGVFRNNDIAQVRLGSEGSYVKNAFMEVDPDSSRSPNPGDMLNGRGVRIESGPIHTGGVTVRDCDIRIAEGASSEGGVVVGSSGGKFDVLDTRIEVGPRYSQGVKAKRPASGDYAPPWPRRGLLRNVSITGPADRAQAVMLVGRSDSTIDSCCIDQHGENRRAFRLIDSGGTVVKNSTLNVSGDQFLLENSGIDRWGNSSSGSCPAPASEPQSTANLDEPTDPVDTGSGDSSSDGQQRKTFAITGTKNKVKFTVEVSGEVFSTWAMEDNDEMSSSSVTGYIEGGWDDKFEYTGEIEKVVVEGDARFVYTPGNSWIKLDNNQTGRALSYEMELDNVWLTDHTSDEKAPTETDDGKRVEGILGGWMDAYGTTGGLKSATIEDVFSLSVEGGN